MLWNRSLPFKCCRTFANNFLSRACNIIVTFPCCHEKQNLLSTWGIAKQPFKFWQSFTGVTPFCTSVTYACKGRLHGGGVGVPPERKSERLKQTCQGAVIINIYRDISSLYPSWVYKPLYENIRTIVNSSFPVLARRRFSANFCWQFKFIPLDGERSLGIPNAGCSKIFSMTFNDWEIFSTLQKQLLKPFLKHFPKDNFWDFKCKLCLKGKR